jgi:hypothetical protein
MSPPPNTPRCFRYVDKIRIQDIDQAMPSGHTRTPGNIQRHNDDAGEATAKPWPLARFR